MQRYSVEKANGEMVVTPDREGKYRASTPDEIKRVLSEPGYQPRTAGVLIGKRWHPLGIKQRSHHYTVRRGQQRYSTPEPIKPPSRWLRILRRLHLYKDPLDVLIYRG